MTGSKENATTPKSTESQNSNPSASSGTNSNWMYGLTWICTEEFEFCDLVDFKVRGAAFFLESVTLWIKTESRPVRPLLNFASVSSSRSSPPLEHADSRQMQATSAILPHFHIKHQHHTSEDEMQMHCNALQCTARNYDTLLPTATHCNTLHHTPISYIRRWCAKELKHTAMPWNTLQHTASHCNTHQHVLSEDEMQRRVQLAWHAIWCDMLYDVCTG